MEFTIECPACRHPHPTHSRLAGKRITCRACSSVFPIVTPRVVTDSPEDERIRRLCGACQAPMAVDRRFIGKWVRCRCGERWRVQLEPPPSNLLAPQTQATSSGGSTTPSQGPSDTLNTPSAAAAPAGLSPAISRARLELEVNSPGKTATGTLADGRIDTPAKTQPVSGNDRRSPPAADPMAGKPDNLPSRPTSETDLLPPPRRRPIPSENRPAASTATNQNSRDFEFDPLALEPPKPATPASDQPKPPTNCPRQLDSSIGLQDPLRESEFVELDAQTLENMVRAAREENLSSVASNARKAAGLKSGDSPTPPRQWLRRMSPRMAAAMLLVLSGLGLAAALYSLTNLWPYSLLVSIAGMVLVLRLAGDQTKS